MRTESHNLPETPPRLSRLFYGWVIVIACVCMGVTHAGVLNVLLSLFMKPMSDDFGWTRSMFSGVVFVAAVGGSILSFIIGPFIDKHGPRLVMVVGGAIIGMMVAALSVVSQLWHFYALFGFGRSVMAGGTSLALPAAVANWFHRKRGRAMAVSQVGSFLGGAVLPFVVLWFIEGRGWRFAWMALGISLALIAVVPSLFVRRRPEDMGLYPDGESPGASLQSGSPHKDTPPLPDIVWTRRAVFRTPAFWMLALADGAGLLGFAAINLHHLPRLTDAGIPPGIAVGTVSLSAACASAASILWGLLAEKVGGRWCVILVLLVHVASTLLLASAWNIPTAYLFAVVWGIAKGGLLPIFYFAWAEYFGRTSLATVRGAATPLTLTGNACGPLLAGLAFDITGSYSYFLYGLTAVFLVCAFVMFLSRAPQRAATPASTQPA